MRLSHLSVNSKDDLGNVFLYFGKHDKCLIMQDSCFIFLGHNFENKKGLKNIKLDLFLVF